MSYPYPGYVTMAYNRFSRVRLVCLYPFFPDKNGYGEALCYPVGEITANLLFSVRKS